MALSSKFLNPKVADNIRVVVSPYVLGASGDADYIVAELPKNALLTDVVVDIKTAYTAASTGTLTVGFKEPGQAISAAGIAADGVTLSEAVGVKPVTFTKHFPNGAIITLGLIKGDSAANIVVRAMLKYSVVVI